MGLGEVAVVLTLYAALALAVLVVQTRPQPRSSPMVWVLALYAMGVPFASALRTGLPAPLESLSSVLGTAGVAMIALHIAVIKRVRPVLDVHVVLWLVTGGVIMATALRTANAAVAWSEVVVLAGLASLYLLTVMVGVSRPDLLLIQRAIALGGAVLGALALAQAVTGTLPAGQSGVRRFEVPWSGGDPNITAASLLLPLALAAYLERIEPDRRDRAIALVTTLLTFGAIVLTSSRAGLAIGAAIVLHHLIARRQLGTTLALLAAAATPAYLAWASFGNQVSRLDSTGRTGVWQVGWAGCAEWCSSGAGLGGFPAVHRDGALAGIGPVPTKYDFEAHSVFLQVMIESGVVALALLVVACVATVWSLARSGSHASMPAILGFLGVVVANIFLSNFSFKYFWLVVMHSAWVVGAEAVSGRPVSPRVTADGRSALVP